MKLILLFGAIIVCSYAAPYVHHQDEEEGATYHPDLRPTETKREPVEFSLNLEFGKLEEVPNNLVNFIMNGLMNVINHHKVWLQSLKRVILIIFFSLFRIKWIQSITGRSTNGQFCSDHSLFRPMWLVENKEAVISKFATIRNAKSNF